MKNRRSNGRIGIKPIKKPTPLQHFIAGIPASEAVWRFAVANELVPHLETAAQLVRKSFHKIFGIRFIYEIDPEIENESWITIRAEVSGSLEEILREHWAYTEAIVQAVPANKLLLNQATCALWVANAELAIGLLDECSKDPLRSRVCAGIRDYEKKIGS